MNRIDATCGASGRPRRLLRALLRARRGIAGLEFALVAPFPVLLMLATADLTFFVRTKLRLNSTASSVAQMVTQYTELYSGDFATIAQASQLVAGSVPVTGKFGATVVSGITNVSGTPVIAWQQVTSGSTFKSQFGVAGSVPKLPGGYVPPVGVTLIVTEVYTVATPWVFSASIMGGAGTTVVGSVSLLQPRLAPLASITPGTRA